MHRYSKVGWLRLSTLLLVMLTTGQHTLAVEGVARLSQSVEGAVAAGVEKDEIQLDLADVDEYQELIVSGGRIRATAQRIFAAHAVGRELSIFDAQTVISRDDDDDGYYHRIKVIFDADTSGDEVWVYARLYLSLEGGHGTTTTQPTCFPLRVMSAMMSMRWRRGYWMVTRVVTMMS
ncbi:MAG: choice-of-anchor H family protein [Candidatus Thiodiazotropha sp.]